MSKDVLKAVKEKRLYFDGGTGTVLQSVGLPAGSPPELWNLTAPEKIIQLHKSYIDAGCNIIKTNTFGVNAEKYPNYADIIEKALDCAKTAVDGAEDVFVAFDMGPTGRLLKPLGDMEFEEAVELFSKNARLAEKYGADLILIETMNDCFETKAAVIGAKEGSSLPIFVTNVYDERGKLMTGANAVAMIAMLESLGIDALGMNCSLGPDKMLDILGDFIKYASLPIIVNPNAGLPVNIDGKTQYNIDAEAFSEYMTEMAKMGATILGGCCGTTPDHIRAVVEKTKALPYSLPVFKTNTLVSSYTDAVEIGKSPILIGERINPTGKPKLKAALKSADMNYVVKEAIMQEEAGVHILDVNVGLPEIDETKMLTLATKEIQAVTTLPLQLDSANPDALECAMRIYNGKPLVNSVSREKEKLDAILPLVKKYGGAVIALTLDENGIPDTAEERVAIANRIIEVAQSYGIDKKDIIVDPLALTVSSDTRNAQITAKTVKLLKDLNIRTSLGVSNVSFGLPCREKINSTFFAITLENGLNCAIMNPFSREMMDVYHSFKVLNNMDATCEEYIEYTKKLQAAMEDERQPQISDAKDLSYLIEKGMKNEAVLLAEELLKKEAPLDIINEKIIPALGKVGADFESNKVYLPQLLISAETASAVFDLIKKEMPKGDFDSRKKAVLATVKGDIHDIGKNIVKVLLESYGVTVIDLGKDVPPTKVLECAAQNNCNLVGLSALMTTTVPAMEETIKLLHEANREIKVMVGGAVLTSEYAKMIKADFYAKDAMEAVHICEEFYK